PRPTPRAVAEHHTLFLVHTVLVGGASLVGTVSLWRALASLASSRAKARRIYAAWLLSFALVGGEVSWILRPFVGSISMEVEFVRKNAFERNLYEFVLSAIVPELLQLRSD